MFGHLVLYSPLKSFGNPSRPSKCILRDILGSVNVLTSIDIYIYYYFMYKYSIGIFLGIGIAFAGSVLAQGLTPYINPLFKDVPIDSKTGLPLNGVSQRENDMTMLYGRLDYISKQIKDLQDRKCAK